ncbi:MAG: 30S ribosomal protein S9 [Flavobacteriales bacterium]|nr:30S ribosomal protein S9 [Flavobacteriales bacterium]MCX7768627.1 30S ribosomal protein S9 [Flavobacteriales bacterium]MDW8409720.1 30S ribosomal protein S9 [Flavobacteriales bacterium]
MTAKTPQVFTGRRKTSVARVVLRKGSGQVLVNNRDYKDYFPTELLRYKIFEPFRAAQLDPSEYDIRVNVKGGGITGQAEATRLAIARTLVHLDENLRPVLRAQGLLTRDPRMVERKKYGRRKARRRFQFSKR